MKKFDETLEKYLSTDKDWTNKEKIGITIATVLFFGFFIWCLVISINIRLLLFVTLSFGSLYCLVGLAEFVPSLKTGKLDWTDLRNKLWQLVKSESKRGGKWILFSIVSVLIIAFSLKAGTIIVPVNLGLLWFIMWVFWWDSNIVTADGFVRFELRESEDEDGRKGIYAIVYGIEIHDFDVFVLPLLILVIPCAIITLW